jgi:hypothetical protein
VTSIHNRQVVVLRPENWCAWLDLSVPEEELLRPSRIAGRGNRAPRPRATVRLIYRRHLIRCPLARHSPHRPDY